ncbi:MAG: AAA family ATPase [Anaerolineae bacterium]|nr:AAA family ATPase [Anaerolineae bacterium]
MLTRIEISGFKSFQDFAVDLRPFQVFIGPNAVGKTNLFDAIALLSHLAVDESLDEALRHARGETGELFTLFPDGTRTRAMNFAVEMLLDAPPAEASGKAPAIATTRLRYELGLESRIEGGRDRVYVVNEGLIPIKETEDRWVKEHIPTKVRKSRVLRERRPPFIATERGEDGKATIYRNQDAPGGGREATSVGSITRTSLSAANASRYPTIAAVREAMRHWRFLQPHPHLMRLPSPNDPGASLATDGSNLAAVIQRLSEDARQMKALLKDIRGFIPSISAVRTLPVLDRDEVIIEIETQEKTRFSSRVLSDGTLRLLALVAMKNDATHRGVLCFEEPENGVQPLRLRQMVDVLFGLSSDVSKESDAPLRQVIVNTHSPGLLAIAPADSVTFMHMKPAEKGRATRVVPVRAELIQDEDEKYLTWDQVNQYLDSSALNRKREELGI